MLQLLDTEGLALLSDEDPHVWLDPIRYAEIARRIATALESPAAAEPFAAELEALDEEFSRGLADCERRELVTSHEAFGYLAERYGLEQIAVTGLSPEAEVDPGRLEDVVDAVRENGATTVFVEPLVSPRIAETVARRQARRRPSWTRSKGSPRTSVERGRLLLGDAPKPHAALRAALGCS